PLRCFARVRLPLCRSAEAGRMTIWITALVLAAASPTLVLQQRHTAPPTIAAWSPDERVIATAAEDGEILLCDSADGSVFARLRPEVNPGAQKKTSRWKREVSRLRFSPDGRLLLAVVESDRAPATFLWDVATREKVA